MRHPPGQPPSLTHPRYRADIDGLRAIAVLAVVVYHAFARWLPGGFIGVDVFFVISGFLISSILYENLAHGTFSLLEFYRRRIARIFPALITVLATCLAAGAVLLSADEYGALAKHVMGGAGFISNLVLWGESGYFDAVAETKTLLHLWSLGIEEQYYLVWPLILWLGVRARWSLLWVTLALLTASFAICSVYLATADPVAAFYSPQSRAWELLMGASLAYGMQRRPLAFQVLQRHYGTLLSIAGAVLLLGGLLLIKATQAFPGWRAGVPTLGAALLIAAGPAAFLNRRLLTRGPLVWIGLISFPLYLWHWPLLCLAHVVLGEVPSGLARLGLVGTSMTLAWGTYRFIERPLRFGAAGWRRPVILLGVMSGIGLASGVVLANHGFAHRPMAQATAAFTKPSQEGGYVTPRFDGHRIESRVLEGISPRRVLFLGDSLMGQYFPRIARLYEGPAPRPHYSAEFVARPGCRPLPRGELVNKANLDCDAYYRAVMKLAQQPIYAKIIVSASWELVFAPEVRAQNEPQFVHDFQGLAEQGKQVIVIALAPHGPEFEPLRLMCPLRLRVLGLQEAVASELYLPRSAVTNAPLLETLAAFADQVHGRLIDPAQMLCDARGCAALLEGRPLHVDDYHLRADAVRERAIFLDPLVYSP